LNQHTKSLILKLNTPQPYFSPDYIQARESFLAAAANAGANVGSYVHPHIGRHGETLSTDFAVLGSKNAPTMLLVQSGTHGVEGYCGSAIQIKFLELLSSVSLRPDTAVMLVHGINPFGFSWCSRGDQNNVDLNRNFIDFAKPDQKRNAFFQKLAPYLIPNRWTKESIVKADSKLEEIRQEYGETVVSQSLRKGQYAYPENVFYGGTGPSWSRLTVERIALEHLIHARNLIFLDIHSGLGKYGDATLLSVEPNTSEKFKTLQQTFGSLVRSTHDPQSNAAKANGNIIRGYSELLPNTMVFGLGVEFGTYEQPRVQRALRADTWLHHTRHEKELPRSLQLEVKQEMSEVFCPIDVSWRDTILKVGCAISKKALNGLEKL
jgi:hypothetical protein